MENYFWHVSEQLWKCSTWKNKCLHKYIPSIVQSEQPEKFMPKIALKEKAYLYQVKNIFKITSITVHIIIDT